MTGGCAKPRPQAPADETIIQTYWDAQAPQHFLYFFALPHGHRSFLPIVGVARLIWEDGEAEFSLGVTEAVGKSQSGYTNSRRNSLDRDLMRMQRVFCEVFEDDSLQLSANDSPATIPDWDSFAHVKLIIGLEEEFGIKFTVDEVAETKTVEGLKRIIASRTGSYPAAAV